QIRDLPGGVEQYLQLRSGSGAGGPTSGPAASGAGGNGAAGSGGETSEAGKREARKEINRIDKKLAKLAAREERLHAKMATASEGMDIDGLSALNAELKELQSEHEALEEAWLEAAEASGQ
ncbi:MAG: ABC transporter ATP-binding protein, partial [Micrococcaceae bacterium]|nr:ABC transporter ATP-binding protein [Micrococcaceae bacterium]